MKRTGSWMLVAMFCICGVMSFLSCTKDNDEQGTGLSIVDFTVAEKDWTYESDNNQFHVWINIPEITEDIYKHGNVQVSLKEITYEKDCFFTLPATYTYTVDDEGEQARCFNETIDFNWTIGGLNLFLTSDDYIYVPEPEEWLFRVYITGMFK